MIRSRDAATEPFPHPCTPKRANPARFGVQRSVLPKARHRSSGWHVEGGGGCEARDYAASLKGLFYGLPRDSISEFGITMPKGENAGELARNAIRRRRFFFATGKG